MHRIVDNLLNLHGGSNRTQDESVTMLHGTWFVVPTPFSEDGTIDLDRQQQLVDAAIGWGTRTSFLGDLRAPRAGS